MDIQEELAGQSTEALNELKKYAEALVQNYDYAARRLKLIIQSIETANNNGKAKNDVTSTDVGTSSSTE
ncbi:MAG: hypothetical protein EHM41_00840 [Chloroflexi bacterium]|nr:MAG: hypothetical protein EHM41_00840 [Chloroflexota bacterium]